MRIIQERAKITSLGEGIEVYDADVQVEDLEERHLVTRYIHLNAAFGEKRYMVLENSVFDYLTGATDEGDPGKMYEEYRDYEATQYSDYAKYFEVAERMVEELGKWE